MRKFIVALVATLALFSTGCTVQVGGQAPETPTASPTPEVSDTLSPAEADALYLETVREQYPQLSRIQDSDLIQIAKDACTMLDNGAGIEELFMTFGNSGNDEADTALAFMIGAGIVAYCPEHSEMFSPNA